MKCTTKWFSHTYIFIFLFKLFSQSGCYKILSRVQCWYLSYSRSLLVIHFKYGSVYMSTPNSLTIPPSSSINKRKVHSNKCQHQEMRSHINNLTWHPKELIKEKQIKSKDCRRKEERSEWKQMKWRLKGQQKRSIKLGDFFKKTNKIDKTLATFAKNKKKRGWK